LKGCPSKYYYPPAAKALPAGVLGIIARVGVGSVNGQRVAILTELVRVDPDDPSESTLQTRVILWAGETLAEDEMPVFDRGFKVREPQAAKLPRYVVRGAKNFTAGRQADVGGSTTVRVCAGELSTVTRTQPIGRINRDLPSGHVTRSTDRFLGLQSQAHAWTTAPPAGPNAFP